MAGTLAMVLSVGEQWEIQFARFFGCPTLSSTCPDLAPLHPRARIRRRQGTWLSSSSSSAALQLSNNLSGSESILNVCFRGKILEQHYVSKLHFSWPQVSCVSGFPARGIRVVFVRYKDHVGEIQKFALRFSTLYETEKFINAVKDILKDGRDFAPLNSNSESEILSQSEFMSSNRHPNRVCDDESFLNTVQAYASQMSPSFKSEVEQHPKRAREDLSFMNTVPQMSPSFNNEVEQHPNRAREDLSFMNTVEAYKPQMSPSFKNEVEQNSSDQEKETAVGHNFEEIVATLPPSFTSLLANCYSEVTKGAAKSSVCEEVDLKSQIMRYMEDSSFQDMLIRVEKVISEMGGDMTL